MHTNKLHNRRSFLKQSLLATGALLWLPSCEDKNDIKHIKGSIVGANSKSGHIARDLKSRPSPTHTEQVDYLIVGGGIAGLTALRHLKNAGITSCKLLEMDNHTGGNSHSGSNKISQYPWGAHYLPVPDIRNKEILDFLQSCGVITEYKDGLPVYNEYHICHDPEERLFINGQWQEGIVPEFGVPAADKEQIRKFFALMASMKTAVGADGKDAFTIPLKNSTEDAKYRDLDKISFAAYLKQNNFTSPPLLWYLEYCCKDDYGTRLDNTSAWAGIHYFAARKGKGANAKDSTVLTWPEGNAFLATHLRKQCDETTIALQHAAVNIKPTASGADVLVNDVNKGTFYQITAKKMIVCTPQFVTKHLIDLGKLRYSMYDSFYYTPWLIANLTVRDLPTAKGLSLCWDNIIYGSESVGYVNANNQDVTRSSKAVLTCYKPYAYTTPQAGRMKLQKSDYKTLLKEVIDELDYAHQGIAQFIEQADLWIWGHGMIAPLPGFIWGASRLIANSPVDNKIFFAHSDLSGISIFEEAFYQGLDAAKNALAAS